MTMKTEVRRVRLDGVPSRALAAAPSPYDAPRDSRLFVARHGRSWFNETLVEALTNLRLGRGPAALVIERVPCRITTVRTPDAPGRIDDGGEWSSETCLLALADFLGIPYGYEREHQGAIIQQVVALPGHDGVLSSEGADADLPFHTENSFAETRPDFVLLLCRRPGPVQVATSVVDSTEVLSRISSRTALTLSRPLYSVTSPASFGEPALAAEEVCVLEQSAVGTAMRLDLKNLLTCENEDGAVALKELFSALHGAGTPIALREGEVLVIDNRRTGHAREGFATTFDGRQRWLQRCLARTDFWGCRRALAREGVVTF